MILARSWHILAAVGYDNIRAQHFLLHQPSASLQPRISAATDMPACTRACEAAKKKTEIA
eukprot:317508-Chlamydomonas_euryale.AAC.1